MSGSLADGLLSGGGNLSCEIPGFDQRTEFFYSTLRAILKQAGIEPEVFLQRM